MHPVYGRGSRCGSGSDERRKDHAAGSGRAELDRTTSSNGSAVFTGSAFAATTSDITTLQAAYTADSRLGVVKSTTSALASTTTSFGDSDTTNTGQTTGTDTSNGSGTTKITSTTRRVATKPNTVRRLVPFSVDEGRAPFSPVTPGAESVPRRRPR